MLGRIRAWMFGVGVVWAALATSALCRAQGADDATRAAARTLGEAGVDAFEAGNYPAATDKLEKAYGVLKVPTLGLWSARALAQVGKLVESAERYREVARLDATGGDAGVQKQAQAQAADELQTLLPRVPSIVISIEGASPGDVQVTLDGVKLPSQLLSEARPLNAGRHVVEGWRAEERVEAAVSVAEGSRVPVVLRFKALSATSPAEPAKAAAVRSAPPTEPRPERDPAARRVTARVDGSSEIWDLKLNDGSLLCRLPCSHWVGPSQAVYVGDSSSSDRLNLALQGGPRSETRFVVKPSRGSPVLAGIATVALGLVAIIEWGIVASPPAIDAEDMREGRTQESTRNASLVIGSIFTLGAAGTGYWWYWSRGSDRAESDQ